MAGDPGICHYLIGIRDERDLLGSPRRGATWEGCMIEQVIAHERLIHPGSQFWLYRTHAGAEVDLVVDRGRRRFGCEFKCASAVQRSDCSGLQSALNDGVIESGTIVYFGDHRLFLADRIEAVPARELLTTGVW